jgi:hypothetical protein
MCRRKKIGELRGDIGAIRHDCLFQKTSMFTKKKTVKPRDAFKNTAFEHWFEIVTF